MLGGGGARGAYEAGAVSVLLPALEARGERPSMIFGTSAGAINATHLAARQHLDAETAVAGLLERWRGLGKGQVIRPLLFQQAPLTALRYVGELLSIPGLRVTSLLDPAPLTRNLDSWTDWGALARNVADGAVEAIAVVATSARSGRAVVFWDGASEHVPHRSHVVDYVRVPLGVEHVNASAAIPILFPAVRIDHPYEARGWYVDGGTRFNTPIKPTLDLGAERLVVVATGSLSNTPEGAGRYEGDPPDFGDGALHLLNGTLVDPLIEDLRVLGNTNAFLTRDAPGAGRYREARGKAPYREVPYIFVGPRALCAIGELALEVYRSRYGGLKGLLSPDFPLLNRLLGGESSNHGELLSYLLFDPVFCDELIRMGAEDARAWLDAPPGPEEPWQVDPLEAFVAPS